MTEQTRTCATCTENDGGLCDLKGILIEDDDTCERWSNKQADGGNICCIRFWQDIKRRIESVINIVDDYNPTNGDKIREMTDSELAQIIMCPHDIDPDICIAEKKDCYECCLEYLQQPAAEEN